MTPAERARAWYPTASAGGGNNMAVYNGVGNKFLWKPVSESAKKCAVHTPAGLRIRSLSVAGKEYVVGSYGNGWRPLFRLDKAGSDYGANVPVVLNLHDGRAVTVLVPSGGKRFEKAFAVEDTAAPDLPLPGQKPPAAKDVSEIMLPASYAADVRLVVAVVGGKLKACVPGDTSGRKWILSGRMGAGDFFAVAWARVPDGVPVVRHPLLGAWSYTDRKTWTDDFRRFGQAAPTPATAPTPAPPPAPARDATLTATGLRLAPDLVPLVAKVLVLTHAETPAKTVKYMASRAGDEWSTGQPLSAYPSAVFQIFWKTEPPARIPHHQGFRGAIKNVSHVMPSGAWNPPTTRNP